jgi:hypothetical protein
MALTILEHQPAFPEEDLSDSNAAFLEMLLQNQQLVSASHIGAESSHLLYGMAHWAANQSKDAFPDDNIHAGFAHGFTMYEIISTLVAPKITIAQKSSVVAATKGLAQVLRSDKMSDFLSDAYNEFSSLQPVTAEVIANASARHYAGLTHYSIMGAAIERQLELEAREFDKNIVQ